MAAPPPYDDSQKYNPGQGPPGYYPQQPGPPGNYPQDQEPRRAPVMNVSVVNRGPMGMFGKDPPTTVCPNFQANITTSVETETGIVAWIAAGLLCAFGCWCCAPIPLCMDNMQVN